MYGTARVIRARYEDGVLKPLGRLDLREGEEVIVSIEERAAHGLAELVESLRRETPKVDEPVKALEEIRK